MAEYAGEKTLDATPHRRQEARKQGHVARSHDLVGAVVLLVGLAAIWVTGRGLVEFLGGYTAGQLGGRPWVETDAASVCAHLAETLRSLAGHVLPLFGLLVLGAVVANLGQAGFLFLPGKLAPDAARLDPIRGFARLFSVGSASRVGFGVLKVVVIAMVAGVDLYGQHETVLGLGAATVPRITMVVGSLLMGMLLKIGFALLVLAVVDYGWQRWRHERDLRMTPQELREEMRNVEGDPELRARRRRVRQQLALGRMAQGVPKADVVLTAPGGAAVAVAYDPSTEGAPVAVAKGSGAVAQRIRELAARHDVPVIEQHRLAETLCREVEQGQAIPAEHYAAVARVLAGVYQQQGREVPEAA